MGYSVIHRLKVKYFISLFLMIFCIFPFNSEDADALVFTMAFGYDPNESSQYLFLKEVYSELFSRLNMEFNYVILPLRRCSIETNDGKYDGEPLRVKNYNDKFPNVMLVNEPVFENFVKAYSIKNIDIKNWESLSNLSIKVGYISGSVNIEQKLLKYLKKDKIFDVKSPEQALLMLKANHIDMFIDIEGRVYDYLQKEDFINLGIHEICLLETHSAYPFVYKKWEKKIPEIEQVLKKIKQDGTYLSIIQTTIPYYSRYYLH